MRLRDVVRFGGHGTGGEARTFSHLFAPHNTLINNYLYFHFVLKLGFFVPILSRYENSLLTLRQ